MIRQDRASTSFRFLSLPPFKPPISNLHFLFLFTLFSLFLHSLQFSSKTLIAAYCVFLGMCTYWNWSLQCRVVHTKHLGTFSRDPTSCLRLMQALSFGKPSQGLGASLSSTLHAPFIPLSKLSLPRFSSYLIVSGPVFVLSCPVLT